MNLPPLPPLPEFECGPHTGHVCVRTDAAIRAYTEQYGRLCADAERAECAKLADEKAEKVNSRWIANDIADAIRARSQR